MHYVSQKKQNKKTKNLPILNTLNNKYSEGLDTSLRFPFFFFFFFALVAIVDQVNSEQCICALFMIPQTSFFSNVFIKNGSHGTIHTVKNYFTTVFSVFSFSKINYIQTNL